MIDRWDERYIALAKHVGSWSKDPSTKVGAVIVRPDRTVASLGYNGFPRGVVDGDDRLNDRPTKYAMVVHAELNAILSSKEDLTGHTLYVSPLHPCSQCAAAIIQSGIKRVVAHYTEPKGDWLHSFTCAATMFREAGVEVVTILETATEPTTESATTKATALGVHPVGR